jgi:hypothetical protein
VAGWGAGSGAIPTTGWGGTGWGGGGAGSQLELNDAFVIAENVVRLQFNQAVRFTKLLDYTDASNRKRYSLVAVDGSKGNDDLPARRVNPSEAEQAGGGGTLIDLTTDRFFSPFPAQYQVSVNGLVSSSGNILSATFTSRVFFAVQRGIKPPSADNAVPRRDFANPQTLQALIGLPSLDPALLGSFTVDGTGDYAADQGSVSYKKRLFRRLTTRKGAFAHLPTYGVGLPDDVKKLGRAGFVQALASDCEAQIRQEPETLDVGVLVVQATTPGLWFLRVRARTNTGDDQNLDVPILVGAS